MTEPDNIVLQHLLTRMPDYVLSPGSTRFDSHMMRGPQSLPVDRASLLAAVKSQPTFAMAMLKAVVERLRYMNSLLG